MAGHESVPHLVLPIPPPGAAHFQVVGDPPRLDPPGIAGHAPVAEARGQALAPGHLEVGHHHQALGVGQDPEGRQVGFDPDGIGELGQAHVAVQAGAAQAGEMLEAAPDALGFQAFQEGAGGGGGLPGIGAGAAPAQGGIRGRVEEVGHRREVHVEAQHAQAAAPQGPPPAAARGASGLEDRPQAGGESHPLPQPAHGPALLVHGHGQGAPALLEGGDEGVATGGARHGIRVEVAGEEHHAPGLESRLHLGGVQAREAGPQQAVGGGPFHLSASGRLPPGRGRGGGRAGPPPIGGARAGRPGPRGGRSSVPRSPGKARREGCRWPAGG